MNYYERARTLATRNTKPTLTDQAGAKDTDINVIVKQFGITGQAPGGPKQPIYEDFTKYPDDLRGFIEAGRAIREHIGNLPKELKGMPLDKLLALPPDEITRILTPPPTPAATEEKK